jgi:twitching motility protein PilT
MVNTTAIGNLIREKKVSEIYSQLQSGSKYGMKTLEQCLNNLYTDGLITQEEALGKASNIKAIKL